MAAAFGVETPPPAWGRPSIKPMLSRSTRNTPTCVGKTKLGLMPLRLNQKHPHLRGEDRSAQTVSSTKIETPPPAWGRRAGSPFGALIWGNTPTCVGKTASLVGKLISAWKHPHLRGEDLQEGLLMSNQRETPPPAWGRRRAAHANG